VEMMYGRKKEEHIIQREIPGRIVSCRSGQKEPSMAMTGDGTKKVQKRNGENAKCKKTREKKQWKTVNTGKLLGEKHVKRHVNELMLSIRQLVKKTKS